MADRRVSEVRQYHVPLGAMLFALTFLAGTASVNVFHVVLATLFGFDLAIFFNKALGSSISRDDDREYALHGGSSCSGVFLPLLSSLPDDAFCYCKLVCNLMKLMWMGFKNKVILIEIPA